MDLLDDKMYYNNLFDLFSHENIYTSRFLQYHHVGSCKVPCIDCPARDKRVFENGNHVILPAHPRCDCYYKNVETIPYGSISNKGIYSPDVWLKLNGELPDYYITKDEAFKLGWKQGKDLSKYAPGKMIGGDIYFNSEQILPVKEGRIWHECDVDYQSGLRTSHRLYYSNDGLMFYSPDHLEGIVTVYFIEGEIYENYNI